MPGLRVSRSGADAVIAWEPVSDLGACVRHEVLMTSDAWPLDRAGLFASGAAGVTERAWDHVGAADDRAFHAYLVRATTPAGTGLLGHYGQ